MRIVKYFIVVYLSFNNLFSDENNTTLPSIKKISQNLYNFGDIIIKRDEKSFSLPAVSNQISGLVEYGIVHVDGKIHESLFRTAIRPQIFHASLLLLRAKPDESFFKNLWSENPKKIDYAEKCLNIEVNWDVNGTKKKSSFEKLFINQARDVQLFKRSFLFTGSRLIEGTFLAESTGSILAIYADDNAIINNCDFDSNNDDVWIANEKEMPPLETPVMISFHLPQ